jgi:hypothetical protein
VSYYTQLISAWNSVTQPPAGVTGTGLTGGMTTVQKIAAVNGWTITGAIPSSTLFSGPQLLNCISWSEFNALLPAQQQNIMFLCAAGAAGGLLGGSANTSLLPVGMIIAYFPLAGVTITNLTALAKGFTQPWWQAPTGGNLNGPVSLSDTTAAGLS